MIRAAFSIAAVLLAIFAIQACCAPPKETTVNSPTGSATEAPFGCTVTGGRLLKPAIDDAAICARFLAALQAALPNQATIGLAIDIRPRGRGEARITLSHAGEAPRQETFGLAVSDRDLQIEDLEALARDAAVQLRGIPRT